MTPIDLDAQPGDLSWADVDPERVRAPDHARALALAIEALMDTGRDGEWQRRAEDEIARRFAREWGPWTCGWRSPTTEDGGVVTSWDHWALDHMPKDPHDDVEPTAHAAADALLEWRAWLARLAALFAQLDVVGRVEVSAPALASAASRIVEAVVEATQAEDAWYSTCAQVLGWFLEHQGVDPRASGALVERAIGGRFQSWIEPGAATRHEVASLLGSAAASALKGDA